jgi:hypothetical protein
MIISPQEIAARAIEAGREFQAIQAAIVRLAQRLEAKCRLFLSTPTGAMQRITEPGALLARFQDFLNKAQQRFGTAGPHAANLATVAAYRVYCCSGEFDACPWYRADPGRIALETSPCLSAAPHATGVRARQRTDL